MEFMVLTPEVSQAPMSSLKDPQSPHPKFDMSVTPPVSHREMGPYIASAAVRSASHLATAVRIVPSSATRGVTVGAGVTVGTGVVVGAGEGAQPPSTCLTPHDVDSH